MNFVEAFVKGQSGTNVGLPTGLPSLDNAINGLQQKTMIGLASPPKIGKSTLTDYCFLLYPYLHCVETNRKIEWIYFSFEMDRIQKEFKFACFFLMYDYNISTYIHNNKEEPLSSDYLQGKVKDKQTNQVILIEPRISDALREIYRNRIVPLFGEYDVKGNQLSKGVITFIERKKTSDEMRSIIENHAKGEGIVSYKDIECINPTGQKFFIKEPDYYTPQDENKFTVIITDTLRKIRRDKGQTLKDAVDLWISHGVEMRNLYRYTFVNIIHSNRSLSNIDRLKHMAEFLYPTGDDVKDTGNLSEEADFMLTLFNPTDEKYGITKHFGLDLYDANHNLIHPYYRSLHLVESRHGHCPLHMQTNIVANLGYFVKLDRNLPLLPSNH